MSVKLKPYEKVLCNQCLRVRDFSDAKHNFEELCECGGIFCGCASCTDAMNALFAGKLKAGEVGCNINLKSWTAEGGCAI